MRKARRDHVHAAVEGYAERQKARIAARVRRLRHEGLIRAIKQHKVKTINDTLVLCEQIGAYCFGLKKQGVGSVLHVDTGDVLRFDRDGKLEFYDKDFMWPASFWDP